MQTAYTVRVGFPDFVHTNLAGTNSNMRANIENLFAFINKAFTNGAAMVVALTERFFALLRPQDQSRLRQRLNHIAAPMFIQVFNRPLQRDDSAYAKKHEGQACRPLKLQGRFPTSMGPHQAHPQLWHLHHLSNPRS